MEFVRGAATGERCGWCVQRRATRVPARERLAHDGCDGSCPRSRCGTGHSRCRRRCASRSMRMTHELATSCARSSTGSSSGIAALWGWTRSRRAVRWSSFIGWARRSTGICICTLRHSMARSCNRRGGVDSKQSTLDRACRSSGRSRRPSRKRLDRPVGSRPARARVRGGSIDRSIPRSARALRAGSGGVSRGSACTRVSPCDAAMAQGSFGSRATSHGQSWIPKPYASRTTSGWPIACAATGRTEPATSRSRPRSSPIGWPLSVPQRSAASATTACLPRGLRSVGRPFPPSSRSSKVGARQHAGPELAAGRARSVLPRCRSSPSRNRSAARHQQHRGDHALLQRIEEVAEQRRPTRTHEVVGLPKRTSRIRRIADMGSIHEKPQRISSVSEPTRSMQHM